MDQTAEPQPDLHAAPTRAVRAVLALGSNLGQSHDTLSGAIEQLGAVDGVEVVAESPLVVSAPVGGPEGQPDYLNQVVEVATTLSPYALLDAAHAVEQAFHRERIVRWGPRTLDIDIITFASLTSDDPDLTLPHPRAAERAFVLVPWAWMDPGAFLDGHSVFELAELADDRAGVHPYRAAVPDDVTEDSPDRTAEADRI